MIRKFILKNTDRFLSRWIVLFFDLGIVAISYFISVFLRFNLDPTAFSIQGASEKLPIITLAYLVGFYLSQSYIGVIRHTSLKDAYNLFKGSLFAFFGLVSISAVSRSFKLDSDFLILSNSILVIHFLLNIFILIGSRLAVKVLYHRIKSSEESKKTRVIIYGAGVSGIITKNTLLQDNNRDYELMGFIDDNPYKIGKALEGIMVYSPNKVFDPGFLKKKEIDQLIISIQSELKPAKRKQIVELCLEHNLEVKMVPLVEKWIHGELSTKQIKSVRIEDLLERDPIVLDNVNIHREIKGKIILVTGAAGSIGSEISRQLLHYQPKKVLLLDQAESPLYDLEYDLKSKSPHLFDKAEFIIGDVTDYNRMKKVFKTFEPNMVFHAAAYKHVPLMEDNPYEAVSVNIIGTKNIADLSAEFSVQKFVMVSTDKAVNPTNVMGATKRTAEIYTQCLNGSSKTTQFITTRFGNVLGSNGSVIPLFRKQIEKGGPITITHKDITRYFMTIPEACNLVLEAGAMGSGGEIFVFDMGESVKIIDLAKKMIKLSGLTLGKDIEIVEVGLRPGEKLYEELLATKENTKSTYHPKIMIAETEQYDHNTVKKAIKKIEKCCKETDDNLQLVSELKTIVPEYISNNSIFASLDLKKVANE